MLNLEQTRLVEENVGLVKMLVHTHTPPAPWSREDLESAGYEALCRAAQRWDQSRGISFSTYAYGRIQGAFVDEIRKLKFGSRFVRTEQPCGFTCEEHEPMAPDVLMEVEIDDLLARTLDDRERLIVRLRRAGVPSFEIAAGLGVHITRISQIMTDVNQRLSAA